MDGKYTIETLRPLNGRFLGTHFCLTQSDVDMANKWVRRIEATRDQSQPMPMDTLRYYNEHGDYYGHALIASIKDGQAEICEVPYTPFLHGDDKHIGGSASGGAWAWLPVSDMVYVGQEPSRFTDWGHCGACADGAVDFEATVNVWEYHAPNKLYGEYNTKTWSKQHIQYREEPSEFGYHWLGNGQAWKYEVEYRAWLETYKGVEFDGHWPGQKVVFHYRPVTHLISRAEWDALSLPTDTRMMNLTIISIKYEYDDEKRQLHEYRYSNAGDLDVREHVAYRVARDRVSSLGEWKLNKEDADVQM